MRTAVTKWAMQCLTWGSMLHTVVAIKQSVGILDKHSCWQGGNKVGEDCGVECVAESKPHGTANLFRCIPSGVVKSAGKK